MIKVMKSGTSVIDLIELINDINRSTNDDTS